MVNFLDSISNKINEVRSKDAAKLEARISRRHSRATQLLTAAQIANIEAEQKISAYLIEVEEEEEELIEDHDKWEQESLLTLHLIGFVVGLSNLWRFPYLCYNNGGGAFLIPYFVSLLLFAYPCIYLELLVGQYTQVGCIQGWKIAPMFKGLGVCMAMLATMYSFNTQTVLAWSLFYLFHATFYTTLPWISCDNGFGKLENGQNDMNLSSNTPVENDNQRNWHTANCREFYADSGTDGTLQLDERLPGSEFLRGRVQRMWKSGYADINYTENHTNGEESFGMGPNEINDFLNCHWDTMISLILVMFIIVICVIVGSRVNGKFLIICNAVPYFVLVTLFFRATGLPGSWQGLAILFKPNFAHLGKAACWWRAAEQVFFSVGNGLGVIWTLGSFNLHNSPNILAISSGVAALNTFTSFLTSSVVFMFLGHIQLSTGRKIDTFIASGPELVFEVMADVLGTLAKANFYVICFYVMLFFLGLTVVIASLICSRTSFLETLPISIKFVPSYRIALFTILIGFSMFASTVNLSRPGLHAYSFQGAFIGSYSILSQLIFLIGVVWVWGLQDIVEACIEMGIPPPGAYFQICWKFVSPIICFLVLMGLAFHPDTHGVFSFDEKEIKISFAVYIIGELMCWAPFMCIIIGAIHALSKVRGKNLKQRFLLALSPTREHKEIISGESWRRATKAHYLYLYAAAGDNQVGLCCGKRSNRVDPARKSVETFQFQLIPPQDGDDMGHGTKRSSMDSTRDKLQLNPSQEDTQKRLSFHLSFEKSQLPSNQQEKSQPQTTHPPNKQEKAHPQPTPSANQEEKAQTTLLPNQQNSPSLNVPGASNSQEMHQLPPHVSLVKLQRSTEPAHDHEHDSVKGILSNAGLPPIEAEPRKSAEPSRRSADQSRKVGGCAQQ